MEEPLIHISSLTFAWGPEPVLEEVDLKVYDRDFIGIIGPNGGGKTTLVKLILGLVRPQKGKIGFREDLPRQKRPIGYLPQVKNIDRQFPITVTDVVRSGSLMRARPFASSLEEKQRATALLGEMGISGLAAKTIGELSGGQMQRVYLCRALISDPRVLILDEPDTYVDNRFEGELYEKLRVLNEKMAILLVSHDVGTITSYVKTIACVNRRLHYHASPRITPDDLRAYDCPIQVITHGDIPHTVLKKHENHG